MNKLNLHFQGSAKEVGRSCIAVETENLNLLMDCGVAANEKYKFPSLEGLKRPHAIAISHAHLDHSGFLPAAYKHANPPAITTFPTIPLVNMLLEDTTKLLTQKNLPHYFSSGDMSRMNRSFLPLPYEEGYKFFGGETLKLFDAGHITGSAQILLKTKKGKLLYSGDFNLVETMMHKPAKIPKEKIDYLIMESTYGDKDHPNRDKLAKEFCEKVKTASESGYAVIIPAFAIGRTQEILQLLKKNSLLDNAVLDGMGALASEICLEFPSYFKNAGDFREAFEEIDRVRDSIDRKRFAKPGRIIICTAGMLEGGPVLSHIQRLYRNNLKMKIFLTGYQVEGTNGRRLMEEGMLRVDGGMLKIKGGVEFYDFSAHSGRKELIKYASAISPEKVFLVHGEESKMLNLKEGLEEKGLRVHIPELEEKAVL